MKTPYMLFLVLWLLPTAGCDKDDDVEDQPKRISATMSTGGYTRSYTIVFPDNYYDKENLYPLVIGLHGTGGSANQFENDYNFSEHVSRAGYIAVYPEGVKSDGLLGLRTWNAGTCCDFALRNNVDDVQFIKALLEELANRYRVDKKRLYAAGMSNGGMLTYRLAAELPETFAAIAAVSSTMVTKEPVPTGRSIPIIHIHSAPDQKVPYNGGQGIGGYYFPPVDSVLSVWAGANGCSPLPNKITEFENYSLAEWEGCQQGIAIERYLTRDGGHAWPGGDKSNRRGDEPSTAFNATQLILNFFNKYSR